MSDSEWGRGIRWPGAPDRGRAPRTAASPLKWVSEDRRRVPRPPRAWVEPAARWGAWAPKVRHPFGITHLYLLGHAVLEVLAQQQAGVRLECGQDGQHQTDDRVAEVLQVREPAADPAPVGW